jgi:hypothetical protein
MTVEDLETNRNVRAVLARNWVNLQKLDYAATHGTIYMRGQVVLLREPPATREEERDRSGVSPKFLFHLEKDLLKVKGVQRVQWEITGWQRTGMSWVQHG